MSVENLDNPITEVSLADKLLGIAQEIYDTEHLVGITSTPSELSALWKAEQPIYERPLKLQLRLRKPSGDNSRPQVSQATYSILDEDMSLIVTRQPSHANENEKYPKNDDEYAEEIYKTFETVFQAHEHSLCINALEQKVADKAAKEAHKLALNEEQMSA